MDQKAASKGSIKKREKSLTGCRTSSKKVQNPARKMASMPPALTRVARSLELPIAMTLKMPAQAYGG